MANLFDTPPSHIRLLKMHGQSMERWVLSYNVPNGESDKLPHGRRFAQVTSPTPHQIGSAWKLTQFQVCDRYDVARDKTVRSYIQIKGGQRLLTEAEIEHIQSLIEQAKKDGNYASPKSSSEKAESPIPADEAWSASPQEQTPDLGASEPFTAGELQFANEGR